MTVRRLFTSAVKKGNVKEEKKNGKVNKTNNLLHRGARKRRLEATKK
jgi:hypothetical protein